MVKATKNYKSNKTIHCFFIHRLYNISNRGKDSFVKYV